MCYVLRSCLVIALCWSLGVFDDVVCVGRGGREMLCNWLIINVFFCFLAFLVRSIAMINIINKNMPNW